MGQRKKTTAVEAPQYKYQSKNECEEQEDAHVFRAGSRELPQQRSDPAVSGRCELCGCNLSVEYQHVLGKNQTIKVVVG